MREWFVCGMHDLVATHVERHVLGAAGAPEDEIAGLERDGADIDWIVSALLHDIGDIYAPYNHDEYAATILRPFVREQCAWVVQTHGDFQMLYYGHHVGGDRHKRDRHRDSPYFDDCAEFCERWDQASFDPAYDTLPLGFFAPMVREVFARNAYDAAVIRAGDRVALVDAQVAASRTG